jgi:hypothetical protein
VLDNDGVVRWQNLKSRRLSGEIVGTRFAEFVGDDDLRTYHELLTGILCRGELAEFTLHIRHADGEIVPVEVSSSRPPSRVETVSSASSGSVAPSPGRRKPRRNLPRPRRHR